MDSRTQRASGTVVDPRTSLAMWLRAGRAQRKLSIEDVAKITKIQPRILAQLEAGNLDGLPATVFVKGFVRSVAKCCGLDEKEAIERLTAAQSGQATAVAKAFVDSMSVRLVQPTPAGEPTALSEIPATVEVAPADAPVEVDIDVTAEAVEMSPAIESASAVDAAPAVEIVEAAPAIEVVEAAPAIEVVEAAPVSEDISKKKKRSKKGGSTAPRSRKKKSALAETIVAAAAEPFVAAVTNEVAPEVMMQATEMAAAASEVTTTELSTTSTDLAVSIDCADSTSDATVDAPAFAEGSGRMSAPEIALAAAIASDEILSRDAIDSMGTLHETDHVTDVAGGSWQPTMPALSTSPSVPWRRPQLPAQSAYVVPTLVIDDADPDSADREREQRAARDQSRLSFLPAILLEREDRSQRQGGLTLAVIILLIAATLTLSYLMRRPSSRGEGVTMLDGSSELLG